MSDVMNEVEADRALKAKHRTMWASGDYAAVAAEVVGALGPVLVEACGVGRGDKVLDVGAGTGNAAIPAALAGASVVASDLTPELLEIGRRRAEERGVELDWRQADAEALPFDDGEFDTVMSCIGVMFAPHHQASADEMLRVCRPGGTIGLLSWTPEGFVGQMFATMKPYAPPPSEASEAAGDDPLHQQMQARIDDLREQLRREQDAHAEARRIILALTSRIPQLEAPLETPEAAESATPEPERAAPRPDAPGPQTDAQRPWWRRWIGG